MRMPGTVTLSPINSSNKDTKCVLHLAGGVGACAAGEGWGWWLGGGAEEAEEAGKNWSKLGSSRDWARAEAGEVRTSNTAITEVTITMLTLGNTRGD